jgi:hypothetical protein
MQAQTIVQTFSFTGGLQTFTVPPCVSSILISASGAQGGTNTQSVVGGFGGTAVGSLPVTSGDVLYIYVGGTNGYNGGGTVVTGGCATAVGGVGGGASDVRLNINSLNNRVIVGGGGGGAGGNRIGTCGRGTGGGGGGGWYGGGGGAGYGSATLPSGGTQSAGGAGGISSLTGYNGSAGAFGLGGAGGTETTSNQAGTNVAIVGGIGGGLVGGVGTWAGTSTFTGHGGGGGSSYLAPAMSATSTNSGDRAGNGQVVITYNFNGAGVSYTAVPSTSICAGTTLTLTAGSVVTYTWLNNNSNSASYTAAPTSNASYTVQGTNSIGCISTSVINVTVNPTVPIMTVANTASAFGGICPNATVNLTASGATTYSWTSSVINGTTFAPTNSATYIVTGANACGTSTAAVSISVHPLPNVTAVASQPTICSVNPVSITGVGNAVTYTIVNAGIPYATNFFPTATAIYTVVGTSVQGCTNTAVTGVTVVTMPTNPPVASPPLICIGSSATLSSSGASNYTWTTPSGIQTVSLISVSPTSTSIYTLTKSNSNCVNTQTITLYVNQLPSVFAIVSPTLICASRTATLQAGGAQTYTWLAAGPPSFSATGANPIVSPSITTLYTVSASDGTCVNTTTVSLATNPNPTINITATSTNICQGDQVSLTANGAIGYSWTTVGVTSNTNSASITESPIAATLYQVTGVNNFNCTSNQQQIVLVRTTPTISIGTTKPLVCKGAPSTLTASSQGGVCTYTWDANAGSVTNSIATVNPLVSTNYTVVGLAVNGCTASQSYPVSVFLPTFAVNSPTSSCQGGTITLTASGANTYTWNGNQPFASIQVSPPSATVYVVGATSNSIGVNCVSTNTVIVSIYTNPTVTAVATRTQICKFETTTVKGQGAVTYAWNTSQTGSLVPVNPNLNTTYTVVGTDQNGCLGTATVLVKVSTCIGITETDADSQWQVSPNPNTGNFTIHSDQSAHFELRNELGQMVLRIDLESANNYNATVTGLSEGIYFLRDVSSSKTKKIVVGR